MVKSGEVYLKENGAVEKDMYIYDQSHRPRCIATPSRAGCGLLTAIQSGLWGTLKTIIPGFAHSWKKNDYKNFVL